MRDTNVPLAMARSLLAQTGALLIKPDAVELGIAEELIYEAQSRLLKENIELTGVAILTVPDDAGHKLYPSMNSDKLTYVMREYLTQGESVIAIFVGGQSTNVTERLVEIRGKQLFNYSVEELMAMPYGLQDSLRGIIPVPGTGEHYRPIIQRLISDRLGLTRPLTKRQDYSAGYRNLVHAPRDPMELCGLLSIAPPDLLREALGGLYYLYELVSSYDPVSIYDS
ncbi:MAG: hypothetical protein WCD37_20425 [Chloroflexia bacterium]